MFINSQTRPLHASEGDETRRQGSNTRKVDERLPGKGNSNLAPERVAHAEPQRRRHLVYGLWFMVYGLWFMVYGLWFMVDGLGFRGAASTAPRGWSARPPPAPSPRSAAPRV